ncbi:MULTISPECIES: MFS transporter [Caldilinea]|uniref:Putative major facilitator superfamily transporter n=1 Tax=Caldilinea aerophila (strain DSM 14535 / JCM 11387 / NBRC 104270 / STL-6-O1) TaxID=926550 RepID=I0I8Z5_CALAS|nr:MULTISPECIES: MFS transporter [Caldilinea]MBO9392418.1 MFS transporter [Caldilinea sp.]BAM01733.1 putative major facilitator superfamily transporter [Caldilinea aerophila DSM 14535 = NBRC 104270]GIV73070.1 MAG: MFS transporter [Caldilinea sp.]
MRNKVLWVLFFGVLMAALDIAIVGPALPAIKTAFAVDERSLAWVFNAYVLTNLIGTPLMAKLSDRHGRRLIYVLDIGLFAVGSALVMSAPSFPWVILGRGVQGLGAGGIFPVAAAVIGDTFPPEKRGGALGLIGAVFGLAFIVGPIVGGLLLLLGWHWIFAINLPIALVLGVAAWRMLPSAQRSVQTAFDWAGMIVLAVLLMALAFGLNQIDTADPLRSLRSLQVWPFLLLASGLLPIFLRVERRANDPIFRPGLLATRQLRLASALAFGAGLGEVAVLFLPSLAVTAFAVSESRASFMLLPLVFALFIGSPAVGRLLDQIGSRWVIVSGSGLLTLGMGLLGFYGASLWVYYAAGVFVGLGLASLLGAPIRYIMLNEVAVTERAAAQAAATLFTSIGQLVGAALVGAVIASMGGGLSGYSAAYLTIGVVALVLTMLAVGLKPRSAELQAMTMQSAGV